MSATVKLVGLDFGTTTSSAVVASAQLNRGGVSGRMELSQVSECFRSDMVFTPLDGDDFLDERKVEELLDTWFVGGNVRPEEVFGGGALLTGLTAQKDNAAALVRLIRRRLANALVATADDPCLESWLSFMGSCACLSRAHPQQAFLNLDVGGGTTNIALGQAGEVLRTGCLFVGARHIQVIPGSYRIAKLSRFARALLDHLGGAAAHKGPGDTLTDQEVHAIVTFYLKLLERVVTGAPPLQEPVGPLHEQVPFHRPAAMGASAITFSGGVGELIYAHQEGKTWPPTTQFGDLGIDLAQRIVQSPVLGSHLATFRPSAGGRATVYGLLRHSTEVSGSTLFLPHPEILPLADIPLFGSLSPTCGDSHLRSMVELVRRSSRGGGLQVSAVGQDAAAIRTLGQKIACVLREAAFPASHPLVLLVRENVGKTLGHYVTEWGALPLKLVVIDEISLRDAQYAQIGSARSQVVPVSFFGLNETQRG